MWLLIVLVFVLFWLAVAGWTMAWRAERGWKQAILDRTAAINAHTAEVRRNTEFRAEVHAERMSRAHW